MFFYIQQHLIVIIIATILQFSISSNNIQTIPELSNNTFAYGFDHFTLIAKFDKSSYGGCTWNINNKNAIELGVPSLAIFTPSITCEQSSVCEEIIEDDVTYIVSELTINTPITFNIDAFVECDGSIIVASWNGLAKNCNSKLPDFVNVISSSISYGSKGRYSCENGGGLFYSNGTYLTSSSTTCLYDATWEGQKGLQCQTGNYNLKTIPELSNNIYAYGFDNLKLIAKFDKSSYGGCSWNINDKNTMELGVPSLTIFTPSITCEESSICEEIIEDDVTYIVSEMTINIPITFNVDAIVECDASILVASWNGLAKNCSNITEFGVVVEYENIPSYNSLGTFGCQKNETLFNSNGTQQIKKETVCNFNALWKNQIFLQCWTAPTVILDGNLQVMEGENINLKCVYDDVIPSGNDSKFTWNGESIITKKNESFTLKNVTRNYNNKRIYCQALTPYTTIYNTTGLSSVHYVEVLYQPQQNSPSVCYWIESKSQSCLVRFSSNCNSTLIDLIKLDTNNSKVEGFFNLYNDDIHSQMFAFSKEKVLFSDNGTYNVIIFSSMVGFTNLSFNVFVEEINSNDTPSSNTSKSSSLLPALIVISCIACIAVIMLIVIIVFLKYKNITVTEKSKGSPSPLTSGRSQVYDTTLNFDKQVSENYEDTMVMKQKESVYENSTIFDKGKQRSITTSTTFKKTSVVPEKSFEKENDHSYEEMQINFG